MSGEAEVDLCVNCYERTYRAVLAPGFFPRVAAEQRFRFARRMAIVNNVDDRADAEVRIEQLRASGELDAALFVSEHIGRALELTGLEQQDLGRAAYLCDWGLVLATAEGPEWALNVDAEVTMSRPADWLTPSIELMRSDARILVANPMWYANRPEHETLARETLEYRDEFALGLGFSDQVFLLRRSDVAGPIYGQRCVAMLRYPMVTVSASFEARLDAWMRHHGRLRATYRGAEYRHPEQIGAGYPDRTLPERLRYGVNQLALAAVRAAPVKRRCWFGV